MQTGGGKNGRFHTYGDSKRDAEKISVYGRDRTNHPRNGRISFP